MSGAISGRQNKRYTVPEYKAPSYGAQSLYNTSIDPSGNISFGAEQPYMDNATKLRGDLLNSLGNDSATNEYTKAYMNKMLQTAQPSMENALIGRGLGGSSVYGKSLADLIANASRNAVLSGQQYNQNNINTLANYLNNQNQLGQSVFGMQQQDYANKLANYQNQYQQQLAQSVADYNYNAQPKNWELGLTKMMSIADPGGSYMGFYNKPTNSSTPQSMSGLGNAMQLYSAFRGMQGGIGSGDSSGASSGMGLGNMAANSYSYPTADNSQSLANLAANYYNQRYGGSNLY